MGVRACLARPDPRTRPSTVEFEACVHLCGTDVFPAQTELWNSEHSPAIVKQGKGGYAHEYEGVPCTVLGSFDFRHRLNAALLQCAIPCTPHTVFQPPAMVPCTGINESVYVVRTAKRMTSPNRTHSHRAAVCYLSLSERTPCTEVCPWAYGGGDSWAWSGSSSMQACVQ